MSLLTYYWKNIDVNFGEKSNKATPLYGSDDISKQI